MRLPALLQADRRVDAEPITDLRGEWAASWILTVARAGVMEPFANHAFQPRTVVRRIDLAEAVDRLLALVAPLKPAAAKAWASTRWPWRVRPPSPSVVKRRGAIDGSRVRCVDDQTGRLF